MSEGYTPKVSRRTTLRWFATCVAAAAVSDCASVAWQGAADLGTPGAVSDARIGGDPDLMSPVTPWSKTMTPAQLALTAVLSEMIIPADETYPSAAEVGAPDFVDEWVSAPYGPQQRDRERIFLSLRLIEQESFNRFAAPFVAVGEAERRSILDQIAYKDRVVPGGEAAAEGFATLRGLVMAAYFASEPGIEDIGYIGNQPTPGDYPGPTPEALAHLRGVLESLDLDTSVLS